MKIPWIFNEPWWDHSDMHSYICNVKCIPNVQCLKSELAVPKLAISFFKIESLCLSCKLYRPFPLPKIGVPKSGITYIHPSLQMENPPVENITQISAFTFESWHLYLLVPACLYPFPASVHILRQRSSLLPTCGSNLIIP